jgi:hypothetical protein
MENLDASGSGNVWVVGYVPASPGSNTGKLVAYRWNGSGWASVTIPHLVQRGWPDVAVVTPANVWIGAFLPSLDGLYLHWNGQAWQERVAPSSISASPEVVPDGTGGAWLGPWAHWNGHAWLAIFPAGIPGVAPEQMARIPGTSSYWLAGGVTDSPNSTVFQPAMLVYGSVP